MSSAIRDLAQAFGSSSAAPAESSSSFDDPHVRLQSAIRLMEKLPLARQDPIGFNKVVMYFVVNPHAVAAYFAFEDDELRQGYLEYLLNNHV